MRETWFWFLGWKDPLEEGMAIDSRTPVCLLRESPWTEEPGGLQPMGSQRVRHDWVIKHSTAQTRCSSSVQFSHSVVPDSLQSHGLQHTRPPCPSATPRVYSNSCPLSQCCHLNTHPLLSPSPPAFNVNEGFPSGACGKEPVCQCRRLKRHRFAPWVGKIPWKREW